MKNKIVVETIKKLELDPEKRYIIFLPESTGLFPDMIAAANEQLKKLGIWGTIFLFVKSTDSIKVVERSGTITERPGGEKE